MDFVAVTERIENLLDNLRRARLASTPTKTVLYPVPDGGCKLVEVEFSWQHGEPIPRHAIEQYFSSASDAMTELASRGRAAQRVHVARPSKKAIDAPLPLRMAA